RPFLPESIPLIDGSVLQVHVRHGGAGEAHLFELRSDFQARVITPDGKPRDPVRTGTGPRGGKDDIEPGLAGVADEDLGAIQDIAIIAAYRGGGEAGRVGP